MSDGGTRGPTDDYLFMTIIAIVSAMMFLVGLLWVRVA